MFYDIRIEPRKDMNFEEIRTIIQNAFAAHGGLYEEGIECLNID